MEAILSVLKEELRQATTLAKRYTRALAKISDGSFFVRRIGSQQYGYITRSRAGVVSQEYLGKLDKAAITKFTERMRRKKKLGKLLKQTKAQAHFLQKAIRHARHKS